MTLSVDGFLSKIGSMGRFQWTLVCVVGIMLVPVTFQTLIMTFLALEPPWRCVQNSTVCNFTRKYVILNGFVHSIASLLKTHLNSYAFSHITGISNSHVTAC